MKHERNFTEDTLIEAMTNRIPSGFQIVSVSTNGKTEGHMIVDRVTHTPTRNGIIAHSVETLKIVALIRRNKIHVQVF